MEQNNEPDDPAMERYYAALAAVPRPSGMQIFLRDGTEGPRHDPYGWTEYSIRFNDGRSATWRDSEFSERLSLVYSDGSYLAFDEDYDGDLDMQDAFEDFVGFDITQLRYWFESDWSDYEHVREAEAAAGWDASP